MGQNAVTGSWVGAVLALTLGLAGPVAASKGAAQGVPAPPSTYFGAVMAGPGYVPASGPPVRGLVADRVCGQGVTLDQAGTVVYVVDVVGEGPGGEEGCGAAGRGVVFEVAGRLMAPVVEWDEPGLHEVALGPMEPAFPFPAIPDVSIEVDDGAVLLSWAEATPGFGDLRLTRYEVWRAESPYFDPALPGCPCVLLTDGMDLSYRDDGPGERGAGNPDVNYFYRVKAVNAAAASGFSATAGEFDFALTAGEPG